MTNKAQSTEAKENEVFVGNVSSIKGAPVCVPEYLSGLGTIRLGKQAYDLDGNKLSPSVYLPLFVARSEVAAHSRIMMDKAFPNQRNW